MHKLNLSKEQFSDFLNLYHKVFFPLENFVTEDQFLNIIEKKKFKKKFFPFPIYFGVNKKIYENIKIKHIISLYYKKKYLMKIKNINFFDIDKKNLETKFMEKILKKILFIKNFL